MDRYIVQYWGPPQDEFQGTAARELVNRPRSVTVTQRGIDGFRRREPELCAALSDRDVALYVAGRRLVGHAFAGLDPNEYNNVRTHAPRHAGGGYYVGYRGRMSIDPAQLVDPSAAEVANG